MAGRPRTVRLVVVNTERQTITVHRSNGEIGRLPYSEKFVRFYEERGDLVGYIPPCPGFVRGDYSQPLPPVVETHTGLTRKAKPERKERACADCNKPVTGQAARCKRCATLKRHRDKVS